MVKKRQHIILFLFSIFIFITGCKLQLGMGESLDLEAPEITITYPEKNANVHTDVTLRGTCTDNIGVKAVTVSDAKTGKSYGTATINGKSWSFSVKLPEGEVTLICSASDEAGNVSVKSSKTISLLVDDTAPEDLSWYVDRGNSIQVPLKSKADLEKLDTTLNTNKDIPQNESFTIYGHLYDAMSIEQVTLKLQDEYNRIVGQKTVNASNLADNESIYTPFFSFTHEELVAVEPSLERGKHILKVLYEAKDEHGNVINRELQYIMWYPESDNPGVEQTKASKGDSRELTINVGSAIPFTFFDDDGITDIYYSFTESIITSDEIDSLKDTASFIHEDKTGYRDAPCQIVSSFTERTGTYYLATYVKDLKGKVSKAVITIYIVDESYPLLIINEPAENSIPKIKTGETSIFEIKGVSNDTSGSSFVKIAYVPETAELNDSVKKEIRAKELFEGAALNENEMLKTFTFPEEKIKGSGKFVQEQFSFDFDLMDFGNEKKSPKFFELMVEDTEGNKTYKQFRVDGDSVVPEIIVQSPVDGAVCDYSHNDLTIKFKATKLSGLGIDESKYEITRKDKPTIAYTLANNKMKKDSDDYVYITISAAEAKKLAEGETDAFGEVIEKANNQPVFILKACDVLGNSITKQISVVLSPLPVLDSITTDKSNGTYKMGDKITIQANFSDSVKVTGTPKLKLYYKTSATEPNLAGIPDNYAIYKSGSNSNSLSFEFIVPAVKVEKLYCGGIELNGGTIETATVGTGNAGLSIPFGENLQDKKNIALDGIVPTISSINISTNATVNGDTKYYIPADKEINVTITCSKNVFVSGSPKLKLQSKTQSETNDIDFTFKSMTGSQITFVHKVTGDVTTSPNGNLVYDESKFFLPTDLSKITDQNGNALVLGNKKNETSNYFIDTVAPQAPSLGTITDGEYNSLTLTLLNIESGATVEYSLDEGVSWKSYTSSVVLPSGGPYKITSHQIDKAGNISPMTPSKNVVVNGTFPPITDISISKADGNYPVNTEIDFKVFLDGKVTIPSATSATLKFVPYDKTEANAGSSLRSLSVTPSVTETNTLIFSYKVAEGDYFNGLKITSLIFDTTTSNKITDVYGNTANQTDVNDFILTCNETNRSGLVLDGIVPVINKINNSSLNQNVTVTIANDKSVTLEIVFNENVSAEVGKVTLQRKGNWAIPAVMDVDIFNSVYNSLASTEDKETLMLTTAGNASGNELTDSYTGQPVGPYKKWTHGLKIENNNLIPDTATKYVLDFNLGLINDDSYNFDPHGKNKEYSVSQIRSVLEKTGYHKHVVDINDTTIVNNKVTVRFSGKNDVGLEIAKGIEWELLIDEGALQDETGNIFGGLKTGDFTLNTNGVATPVVRVDRYSHGKGAKEPKSDGTLKDEISGYTSSGETTHVNNSGSTVAPTGYCRVRIDCETLDAKIFYKSKNAGSASYSNYTYTGNKFTTQNGGDQPGAWTNGCKTLGKTSSIADISFATLKAEIENNDAQKTRKADTEYNNFIIIGDGEYTTASKDYVIAYAKKGTVESENYGYEGVFKTLVYSYGSNNVQINAEGGTAKGGEPNVSGFPLRDATSDTRYSKNAYYITKSQDFAWVSYEIITSNWAYLQKRKNYSYDYPISNYGQVLYLYCLASWGEN